MKKSELRQLIEAELKSMTSPTPESSDVKTLKALIERNTTLLNRLKTVNNGKEVNEFLSYILSLINEKVTGVNKSSLIKTLNQKFK